MKSCLILSGEWLVIRLSLPDGKLSEKHLSRTYGPFRYWNFDWVFTFTKFYYFITDNINLLTASAVTFAWNISDCIDKCSEMCINFKSKSKSLCWCYLQHYTSLIKSAVSRLHLRCLCRVEKTIFSKASCIILSTLVLAVWCTSPCR